MAIFRVSFPLLLLSLLLFSTILSSLAYIPSSNKVTKGVDPIPNCSEIGSRSECQKNSKWCRWCRSEALDDMCFGSSEAWRLPRQSLKNSIIKILPSLSTLKSSCSWDADVIVKIESADSIPSLHSIMTASDGQCAELPIEDVLLLQEEIIRLCRSMPKLVIVAMNMVESMIEYPTLTRAEVPDIEIAVRQGNAVMQSGETPHGKHPLKAVYVMHSVALRAESALSSCRMQFSDDDDEETFSRAINCFEEGKYVALAQSGMHSVWGDVSTHHSQVRKV